ncbi:hypothetical protein [Nostoc sp. FACHB-280]|uniref:hypothetical protein n=1 Tax=Nostoc sp. FACHB-280 TaxID=2692839 RepID=UPI00168B65E4|nr:hypothetical protein [Nostoc sp. FACHB-280]MBD2498172.1 hypothetical protein [Nostoc sp. FACHB-280]
MAEGIGKSKGKSKKAKMKNTFDFWFFTFDFSGFAGVPPVSSSISQYRPEP